MSTPQDYSALITSEHSKRPLFVAMVELTCSPASDGINALASIPGLYDLDNALGVQLDVLGRWIGLSRSVNVPTIGTVLLSDSDYKLLLRAKIAINKYDGSWSEYQHILQTLFVGTGFSLYGTDNQDMSITIYIQGDAPSALQLALITGGLLIPKPEGVRITGYVLVGDGPLFGTDHDDSSISGPDVGAFATIV